VQNCLVKVIALRLSAPAKATHTSLHVTWLPTLLCAAGAGECSLSSAGAGGGSQDGGESGAGQGEVRPVYKQ
jgi:hypothetical protein